MRSRFLVAIAFVWRMAPSPPHEERTCARVGRDRRRVRFLKGQAGGAVGVPADSNAMIFAFPVALFPAVADGFAKGGDGAAILGLLTAAPAVGAFWPRRSLGGR
jgi:hypothetical protein